MQTPITCGSVTTDCQFMTPAEEKRIKPSKNRQGDFLDRTVGDRTANLSVQLTDYDVNDWIIRKPKHNEGTDRVIEFIRERARESSAPIAVTITGSASRTGGKEYNDLLSCKRSQCVSNKLRAFLAPAIFARLTLDTAGEGFSNAACVGPDCERPEFRSTLISVHAVGRKPAPVPVVPRGWDKYRIRCMSYASQDLASSVLGDVLDKDFGSLSPTVRAKFAHWMAALIKKSLKSIPKVGGAIARVLKLVPVTLIRDCAVFELVERDRPAPASTTLCYTGTGLRLDVPNLDFVDLALPNVPAPLRNSIKAFLSKAGLRSGLPPLVSRTLGPFVSFELSRPALLREFSGNVFMGKDALSIGRVHVVLGSPAFRTLTGQRARILKSSRGKCEENVVPIQVGSGRGVEVLAFSDGNWVPGPCRCDNASPDHELASLESRAVHEEWAVPFSSQGLSRRHRLAYGYAQQAELLLEDEALEELMLELLAVESEGELEQFLGKLLSTVSHAASNVAKSVAKGAASAARGVVKAAGTVGKVVAPIVATAAKLASHSPLGSLARSAYGAVSALARGENILMGALDGLAGTPLLRGLVKMGGAVLRGENVIDAAKLAVKAGIDDVREAARFAAMVAPFVPGIGTGVGAALGAANALASGQPISEAMVAGVRGALPGGAIAQAAFDLASNLVKGQRLDQAVLGAARNQLPAGIGQAAFDTGLAIVQGQKLQEAMLRGAGGLLPPSPYSGDVMSFARRAVAGENLGRAALSTVGNAVLQRVEEQGGDLIRTVQGRAVSQNKPLARAAPGKWSRELYAT